MYEEECEGDREGREEIDERVGEDGEEGEDAEDNRGETVTTSRGRGITSRLFCVGSASVS